MTCTASHMHMEKHKNVTVKKEDGKKDRKKDRKKENLKLVFARKVTLTWNTLNTSIFMMSTVVIGGMRT